MTILELLLFQKFLQHTAPSPNAMQLIGVNLLLLDTAEKGKLSISLAMYKKDCMECQ